MGAKSKNPRPAAKAVSRHAATNAKPRGRAGARSEPARPTAATATKAAPVVREMTTSTLHLPAALLELLRMVAVRRATASGGRPSVSAVVVEIMDRHRPALEAELKYR